jgi:dihydroneopterin aldolase
MSSADYYRVLVRDLVLGVQIGVWKREKNVEQRVRINVELLATKSGPLLSSEPGGPGPRNGRRDRILRYDTVVSGIRKIVAEGHFDLCETLAERIADLCLENRRVKTTRVRVEKLDVYPDAASVGAEIERHRGV